MLAKRKDGSVFPIHLSVGEMRFGDEVTFIGIARDVSDRHAAEERARFLTNHDPLTGLLTRRAFLEQCDREMAVRLPSGDMTHVVFSFDVDQFREINEGLGYHIGDGVLKAIVARFGEVLPRDSTLCRVGADEFAALACFPSRIAAEDIADQVHARLLSPIYVDRQLVLVRMSIGAAVYDPSIKRVEELLTKAELALQTVQHQGGNGVCFYTPEMALAASRRTLLTMHLAHAVQRNELNVVYQPIIEVEDRPRRRGGSAAALVPHQPGRGFAGRVHPDRRGQRPDRLDHRLGAGSRGRAGGPLARRRRAERPGLHERLGPAVPARHASPPGLPS